MNERVCVIVSGAAGFLGINLVNELLENGYEVFAQVRPFSVHNKRLEDIESENLHIFPLDMNEFSRLPEEISERFPELFDEEVRFKAFFHLMWGGERNDFEKQKINIEETLTAIKICKELQVDRFIATGSQAEYGSFYKIQKEDCMPRPENAYGSCKTSAMYLSRELARQYGIEWIWTRIFSLIGSYEPDGRMFPMLIDNLLSGKEINLSSGKQMWNYLDAKDAARALRLLCEKGKDGEIYNVAGNVSMPLMNYVKMAEIYISQKNAKNGSIVFGADANPFVNLVPDISKLVNDTGFEQEVSFEESIENHLKFRD